MPHLRLDYTTNITEEINFQELFHHCHEALQQIIGVDIAKCDSQARQVEDFFIGKGEKENAFVHLTIYLFEGRSKEMKQRIGTIILPLLEKAFSNSLKKLNLHLVIFLRDLEKDFYFKNNS